MFRKTASLNVLSLESREVPSAFAYDGFTGGVRADPTPEATASHVRVFDGAKIQSEPQGESHVQLYTEVLGRSANTARPAPFAIQAPEPTAAAFTLTFNGQTTTALAAPTPEPAAGHVKAFAGLETTAAQGADAGAGPHVKAFGATDTAVQGLYTLLLNRTAGAGAALELETDYGVAPQPEAAASGHNVWAGPVLLGATDSSTGVWDERLVLSGSGQSDFQVKNELLTLNGGGATESRVVIRIDVIGDAPSDGGAGIGLLLPAVQKVRAAAAR